MTAWGARQRCATVVMRIHPVIIALLPTLLDGPRACEVNVDVRSSHAISIG
jgi:hypothetical protein